MLKNMFNIYQELDEILGQNQKSLIKYRLNLKQNVHFPELRSEYNLCHAKCRIYLLFYVKC